MQLKGSSDLARTERFRFKSFYFVKMMRGTKISSVWNFVATQLFALRKPFGGQLPLNDDYI